MNNENQKINITWDDVNKADVNRSLPVASPGYGQFKTAGKSTWGTVTSPTPTVQTEARFREILLMKGWFYLGLAGFLGAFLAWMVCEPAFEDGLHGGWGAAWMTPLVIIFMCISLGTVESLIERSWQRAFRSALASACVAVVLGLLFYCIAGFAYLVAKRVLLGFGVLLEVSNPLYWFARAFAWAVLGIAGGLVFGIVSKSGKKAYYGILGGLIGGAVGGFLFDPVNIITGANQGAEVSRAIGFSILGVSTGIAIGLVESALKERWLYVTGGPLAGKQFVLYQDHVTMGKLPSSTIYLFKDPEILEQHAIIQKRSGKSLMTVFGPVLIGGQLLQTHLPRVLKSGEVIQIGRYTFTFAEKERTMKA